MITVESLPFPFSRSWTFVGILLANFRQLFLPIVSRLSYRLLVFFGLWTLHARNIFRNILTPLIRSFLHTFRAVVDRHFINRFGVPHIIFPILNLLTPRGGCLRNFVSGTAAMANVQHVNIEAHHFPYRSGLCKDPYRYLKIIYKTFYLFNGIPGTVSNTKLHIRS